MFCVFCVELGYLADQPGNKKITLIQKKPENVSITNILINGCKIL